MYLTPKLQRREDRLDLLWSLYRIYQARVAARAFAYLAKRIRHHADLARKARRKRGVIVCEL